MSRSIYLPSVAVTLAILALAIDGFARTLVGSCAAVMALLLVLAASAFCIQQVGAEMWLFDCTGFGTSYDLFTTATDLLHATDTQFDTRLVNAAYDIVNPL